MEGFWRQGMFVPEEEICLEDIKSFCRLMPHHFAKTAETEYGTFCDALAENNTGGTNVIEAKHREEKYLWYLNHKDIFIEYDKYWNLMRLYKKGVLPFYLNKFEGDENFYLWILPSVPLGDCKFYGNVKIEDKTTGGYKYEDRYGLKKKYAWTIKPDGKIIWPKSNYFIKTIPPTKHDIDFNKPITNDILNSL